MCRAFELPEARRAALCRRLAIDAAELALWDAVSRSLRLAFHGDGIISRFAGYERLRPLDPDRLAGGERVDRELAAEGDNANACQIARQADLPMLFSLLPGAELAQGLEQLGYRVSREQLCRILAYYLTRTRHDSSLSRITHAGALARLDPAASWHLFEETLQRDASPMTSGSAEERLHPGAMAGVIDVIRRHYLGLRPTREAIRLDPAAAPELGPVSLDFRYRQGDFRLEWSGSRLRIAAAATNRGSASVCCGEQVESLRPGAALDFDWRQCRRARGRHAESRRRAIRLLLPPLSIRFGDRSAFHCSSKRTKKPGRGTAFVRRRWKKRSAIAAETCGALAGSKVDRP